MTTNEFRYEFDILWNNIMSNRAPGLSTYEISVFLTQAQETIIKGIYNGSITNSFESTEDARSYLTPLVIQGYPERISNQADYPHITNGTILFNLDNVLDINGKQLDKPWFIVYEGVIFGQTSRCRDDEEGIVKPVTHDTFWETKRNPFRKDNERKVLRLTFNSSNNFAELISENDIEQYYIRYIRKPKPIIVEELPKDSKGNPIITIDGEYLPSTCKLNENLHRAILETAVKLAQQAWVLTRQQTQ